MTFTKEHLITRAKFLIKRYEDSLANHPEQDGVAMELELARMALAGMEAEPVACIDQANLDYLKSGSDADVWPVASSDTDSVLLYTAPQPLTTSERAELENYRNAQQVVPSITKHFDDIALETAREIMCDVNRRHEFLGGEVQLLSRIQCRIDNALRAAMQSGAVKDGWVASSVDTAQVQFESLAGNYPEIPDCWCRTCRPVKLNDMRFVVCPDCGNKRCPHANDHRNACTGSNEPGQEGSAYPAAPQQEVTQALAKGMERYSDAMQELAKKEAK